MSSRQLTICIPTYNRKKLVCELVSSIVVLDESLGVEVLVIDDGSSDGTYEALRALVIPEHVRINILRQDNKGFTATFFSFFALCQTEYFMLADDDMQITDKIFDLIQFLEALKPDFVSPVWLASDGYSVARGRNVTQKIASKDLRAATDHGPGLVFRIHAFRSIISHEISDHLYQQCYVTHQFPILVLLLYAFLKTDAFWWCPIATCGYRKAGAEPSNICDIEGEKYTSMASCWNQQKYLTFFYAVLIEKASTTSKKKEYQKLLLQHNRQMYRNLRAAVAQDVPELVRYLDSDALLYCVYHFFRSIKAVFF